MTGLFARPFTEDDVELWEDLVARSWNGTFIHSRRYLSYAGERFADASLVIEDDKRRAVGVFPAAVHASDPAMIESHPGTGYGGLVHEGSLRGAAMLDALEAVGERYYHDGRRSLRYKAVPYIYQRVPAADDLYALYRLGATRARCDLASVIDVEGRPTPSKRRARSLRKAERAGVGVERGPDLIEPVWSVLTERLAGKHQAETLHTLPEMLRLQSLFPDRIECVAGTLAGQVVAGVVLFRTGRVDHSQYIGADDRGYATSALDTVFEHCIAESGEHGTRYFSFGNSTLYGGRVFSESLHQFKSEFGAGGVVHEAYDLLLA